jgi:hypothetical protein
MRGVDRRARDDRDAQASVKQSEGESLRLDALHAADRLRQWLESNDLRGYDPYDALRSPLLSRLATGRRRRQLAIQALRRLPFNARPVLGIRPYANAKGLGLIAQAAAKLFAATDDAAWRQLAERAASDAVALKLETDTGVAWGYPFDVQFRWGFYAAGSPNVIATVFTANSLLTTGAILERSDVTDVAAGTAPFVESLFIEAEGGFFAYVPGNPTPIHNANVLAAALRRKLAGRDERLPDVEAAVEFTLTRQRPDGSWPYGEGPGLAWIDGFHTAYVLAALQDLYVSTGRDDVEQALRRGTSFYIERLFDPDGTPRYLAHRSHPLDAHNAATAIATLSRLARYDPRASDLAGLVLRHALTRLQTTAGWFVYQRGRLHTKHVPYIRWSDAHMLNALADFVTADATRA